MPFLNTTPATSSGGMLGNENRVAYKIAKKGKPSKKDLPLLKNDITGSELTFKMTDT
jgi:hypothetical protein